MPMLSGGSRPDSVPYVVWLAFDCEHECFCPPSTPERIKILYTNDIESVLDPLPAFWRSDMQHIGGIAKLATLIGKERATDQPTVLLMRAISSLAPSETDEWAVGNRPVRPHGLRRYHSWQPRI